MRKCVRYQEHWMSTYQVCFKNSHLFLYLHNLKHKSCTCTGLKHSLLHPSLNILCRNNLLPFTYKADGGFPSGWVVKNPPVNAGGPRAADSISGSRRSPGVGKCNSLQYFCLGNATVQYSCLENAVDRGAWRTLELGMTEHPCVSHGVSLARQSHICSWCSLDQSESHCSCGTVNRALTLKLDRSLKPQFCLN